METVRNVSMQSLILQKPGGGNMHLLPGRAIGMTDQQLAAPQVQTLLNRGLLAIEVRLTEPATGTTGVAVTGLPETPVPPAVERRRTTEPAIPRRGQTENTNR